MTQAVSGNGRAADNLVNEIEALILSDQLLDGDTLPAERDLMHQYSVSRTVVREALTTLAGKGLIITRPRFRPVVRKPDYTTAFNAVGNMIGHLLNNQQGIRNLFDTRLLLEATLVREAALHANKDDIRALREALEANRQAVDDSEQFYLTDVAFHAILYRIGGNPVLWAIHQAYTEWLGVYWRRMPMKPDRNQMNYDFHEAMFNGILNRDPDEAEAALREHLIRAWQDVEPIFQQDVESGSG